MKSIKISKKTTLEISPEYVVLFLKVLIFTNIISYSLGKSNA